MNGTLADRQTLLLHVCTHAIAERTKHHVCVDVTERQGASLPMRGGNAQ